VKYKN